MRKNSTDKQIIEEETRKKKIKGLGIREAK